MSVATFKQNPNEEQLTSETLKLTCEKKTCSVRKRVQEIKKTQIKKQKPCKDQKQWDFKNVLTNFGGHLRNHFINLMKDPNFTSKIIKNEIIQAFIKVKGEVQFLDQDEMRTGDQNQILSKNSGKITCYNEHAFNNLYSDEWAHGRAVNYFKSSLIIQQIFKSERCLAKRRMLSSIWAFSSPKHNQKIQKFSL